MWFFVLLINLVAVFVFYRLLVERIKKNSDLEKIMGNYRKELRSYMVELNKVAHDNTNVLDEKINEAREVLRLAGKIEKSQVAVPVERKVDLVVKDEVRETVRPSRKKSKSGKPESASKKEKILGFFNKGDSIPDIARKMDITQNEVKLYLRGSTEI